MAVKDLILRVRAEGAQLAQTQFQSLGKSISNNIAIYASLTGAGYAVVSMMKTSLNAYMESERMLLKLRQQIGGAAFAMADYADKLSMITAEDDESIMGMMAMLAVTVKNEDQLKKLSAATIDFAKYMGIDLQSAGEMVMRTLQGTRNAFMMYGVDLKGAKTEQEKLNIMIQRFGEIAGGYAAKASDTLEGRLEKLGIMAENVAEGFGGALASIIDFMLKGGGSLWDLSVYQAEVAAKTAMAAAELPKELSLLELLKNKMDVIEAIKRANMTPYELWLEKKRKDVALTKQLAEYEERYALSMMNLKGIGISKSDDVKALTVLGKKLEAVSEIAEISYDKMDKGVLEYADTVTGIANQISDAWSQALLNQWNSGQSFFENMVRGFEQMLASMIAQLAAKSAIFAIFSLIPGMSAIMGGKKGGLGGFLFPGAQHGADFTVGGSGGADSQFVGFRASPGERVTVTPPNQSVSNSSININIEGHIVDSRLIQRELIPALRKAQRLGYQ